ncbi:hypothetical protein Kpho01_50140 [Kitasatospora phosalacinea]|uniref:DUF4132 domain-containing protein n=2 Tax=Kitasatospora phosalacinea TaxID=2065 RepID=A0A9W6PLF5_9ACTN|nr:hypothetical protein Kpho01_50140 [Kitasatospora phosalacinea]
MRHGGSVGTSTTEGGTVGGGTADGEAAGGGLPDEDAFVLPEAWRALVAPRRRGGAPAPVAADRPPVDPDDAYRRETLALEERAELIEELLAEGRSDPELTAATWAYLYGEGGPVGAALAARIIRTSVEPDSLEREFADRAAWAGLSFAVRTVLASLEADFVREWSGSEWRYRAAVLDLEGEEYLDLTAQYGLLAAAGRALAEAPEDEHAAVVEELEQLRSTPVLRAAIARLVPERAEWVDECLAELPEGWSRTAQVLRTLLLPALGSAAQVERFGPEHGGWYRTWTPALAATLADRVGPAAAAALLASAADQYSYSGTQIELLGLLAEFPTDGAMRALVGRIGRSPVRALLLEMVERFPVRAVRVLSSAARGGGADAAAARELLDRHVAQWRPRLPEVLARLDEATAAFVRGLPGAREPLPEAAPERLPAVLVDPPWTRRRAAREPVALTGLEADREARLVWREGEEAAFAGDDDPYWRYGADTDWAKVVGELSEEVFDWQAGRLLAWGPDELVLPRLAHWRPAQYLSSGGHLPRVLGRYGTAALRLLHLAARDRPEDVVHVLLPVLDAETAGVMAHALLELKSVQPVARSWFSRHGVAGALLLVPAAVGAAGPERRAAEHALRLVAARAGAEALSAAAAERYGERAAAAVAEVLGEGALLRTLPGRMPKPPRWLRPELLPQVLLADGGGALRDGGGALPGAAVRHLLAMLQLGLPRRPYPGLAVVAPALRADTTAAFCWALFEEWRHAGMPAKDAWALHALGVFGDGDTARRLVPVLPMLSHQRAVDGLDVLVSIGNLDALVQLHGIARTARSEAFRARAQERVAEVAESLGLSAEQLGDRLVPDLGLSPDGTTVIDYGPRTFTVGFDEQLRPYVRDSGGKPRRALPAAASKDDPDLAAAGRRRFTALKKEVRAFTTQWTARLRDAMVAERSWSAGEFTDLLLAHPVLGRLVRRLLWTADGAAFRIAEDGSCADARDEAFALPGDATVRLVHPLHLTAADLAAWRELLADYEVIQPFPQLERPVLELSQDEADGHRLHRFEGRTVPVWRLLALAKHGWRHDETDYRSDGVASWFHRPLPDGRHLVVQLDPGARVHSPAEAVQQTLEAVWLGTSPGHYWPEHHRESSERFGSLPPVLASELLADLEELTSP